jgi:hypothetical protein
MSKELLAALLVLQAHFAASYLVPLDREAQETLGGLLRWAWPWSGGYSGPLGPGHGLFRLPAVRLLPRRGRCRAVLTRGPDGDRDLGSVRLGILSLSHLANRVRLHPSIAALGSMSSHRAVTSSARNQTLDR